MEELLAKYRSKGVLVDTNLMLLMVVGSYAPERITTFKRTQQYRPEDYLLLLRILKYFERRITTPNILTEVDNLARQLPEHEHQAMSSVLSDLVRTLFEVHRPAADATQVALYSTVGLTDCITIYLSSEVLVITDDFQLSNRISSLGRDSLNINHIRAFT